MSLRQLEGERSGVRCLTHHFLAPLASNASTPSTDTVSSSSTYISANSSLSSPDDQIDTKPLKHTFAHTISANAIVKGPTGYDLVTFGEGGTNVMWLSRTDNSHPDSDDDDDDFDTHEFDKLEYKFWVATFPMADSTESGQEHVRRLRLPRTISPRVTAAMDLDDTQGVMCIATTHGEVFRLRFD